MGEKLTYFSLKEEEEAFSLNYFHPQINKSMNIDSIRLEKSVN